MGMWRFVSHANNILALNLAHKKKRVLEALLGPPDIAKHFSLGSFTASEVLPPDGFERISSYDESAQHEETSAKSDSLGTNSPVMSSLFKVLFYICNAPWLCPPPNKNGHISEIPCFVLGMQQQYDVIMGDTWVYMVAGGTFSPAFTTLITSKQDKFHKCLCLAPTGEH
eukprot:1149508-Pelagomonas_calceolata.AAC.2